MRIPIAANLESRDGAVTKDAKNLNCIVEIKGEDSTARKRPGLTDGGSITSGTPQMLDSNLSYIYSCIGNNVRAGVLSAGTYSASGGPISLTAGGSVQMAVGSASAANQFLMFKTANQAYYTNNAALGGGTAGYIASNYPNNLAPARATVPGIVFIDGYFVVMDAAARIYNSNTNDPSTWSALGYLTAQSEPGAGVALGRTKNYVVAFKEYSVELFYDAANPVGSPLSPVESGFIKIGCASAGSVAQWNEALVWMSQSRQAGRGVHMIDGIQSQKISTPDVDRILNADDLATVYAYSMRLDGHDLYVLTLVTSNITLVYDFTSQHWGQWSTCTIGSSKSVSSITRSGTTATVTTSTSHGLSDGDPVTISGATQSDYNGIFPVCYVSSTVFTIEVANSPATPATGTILAYPYTETYFKQTHYANYAGVDLLLHVSDGHLYKPSSSTYQDNAAPINVFTRTSRLDGGVLGRKKISAARVTADYVSDTVKIRWSDDDSQTFTTYRDITLSVQEPEVRRSKSFRRRSYELRHTGNNPLKLKTLELEVSK